MKINKLTLTNFKSFTEKEFTFGDVNLISGRNGSGKTTIKEAIFFCLYNKTPLGSSPDTSKYVKNGEDICVVELELEIEGKNYLVKRQRSSKTTVLRLLDGSQSEEDAVVTQRDMESILPPFDLFQNVFNVRYFMSLPDKDKREFILNNTKEVNKKSIFDKLAGEESTRLIEEHQLSFEELDNTYKHLLAAKLMKGNLLKNNNVLISDSKPIEKEHFNPSKLIGLEKKYSEELAKKKEVTESAIEWEKYNNRVSANKEIEQKNKKIRTKIESIVIIEGMRKPDDRKLTNILEKRNEIKKIIDLPEGKCPVCFQHVGVKHQDKISQLNDKNLKKAKKIESEIGKISKEHEDKESDYLKNERNKQEVSLLTSQLTEVEKTVKPKKKIVINLDKEEKLREKITELKINKNNIEQTQKLESDRLEKIEGLKDKNAQWSSELVDLTKLIKIFSPHGIRSEEMRIKLGPILTLFNKYIPNSDIKTLQILKNGKNYKEVFQVFSEGKEFSKMSLGEKTKIDICISKIIDQLCGDKIKSYFIDNAEIVDQLPEIRKQTFAAKVNKLDIKIKTI